MTKGHTRPENTIKKVRERHFRAKNERFWVKFHFKTMQGHKHWANAEAAQVVGRTRESQPRKIFTMPLNGEISPSGVFR